jgi:hypothetical protein
MATNYKRLWIDCRGYKIKVELKHENGGKSHVGLAFNIKDQNNYEALYLR